MTQPLTGFRTKYDLALQEKWCPSCLYPRRMQYRENYIVNDQRSENLLALKVAEVASPLPISIMVGSAVNTSGTYYGYSMPWQIPHRQWPAFAPHGFFGYVAPDQAHGQHACDQEPCRIEPWTKTNGMYLTGLWMKEGSQYLILSVCALGLDCFGRPPLTNLYLEFACGEHFNFPLGTGTPAQWTCNGPGGDGGYIQSRCAAAGGNCDQGSFIQMLAANGACGNPQLYCNDGESCCHEDGGQWCASNSLPPGLDPDCKIPKTGAPCRLLCTSVPMKATMRAFYGGFSPGYYTILVDDTGRSPTLQQAFKLSAEGSTPCQKTITWGVMQITLT